MTQGKAFRRAKYVLLAELAMFIDDGQAIPASSVPGERLTITVTESELRLLGGPS